MKSFVSKTSRLIKNNLFTGLIALALSSFVLAAPGAFAAEKSAKKTAQVEQKIMTININRASIKDLEGLKGIGEKKAIAIVKYRNEIGKFKSVEQLAEVKGIGAAIIEKNRKNISL